MSERFGRGMIYFIQPGAIQKVKIGFVLGNLKGRVRQLQTGSCEILNILGVIPDISIQDEHALHAQFKQERLHLEWFTLSRRILDFIAVHAVVPAYDPIGNWIGYFKTLEEAKQIECGALVGNTPWNL